MFILQEKLENESKSNSDELCSALSLYFFAQPLPTNPLPRAHPLTPPQPLTTLTTPHKILTTLH